MSDVGHYSELRRLCMCEGPTLAGRQRLSLSLASKSCENSLPAEKSRSLYFATPDFLPRGSRVHSITRSAFRNKTEHLALSGPSALLHLTLTQRWISVGCSEHSISSSTALLFREWENAISCMHSLFDQECCVNPLLC